jgi:hypothetical protein
MTIEKYGPGPGRSLADSRSSNKRGSDDGNTHSLSIKKIEQLNYLRAMTSELHTIADHVNEPFLAYLLDLVVMEAEKVIIEIKPDNE